MFTISIIITAFFALTLILQFEDNSNLISTSLMDRSYTTIIKGMAILFVLVSHIANTMHTVVFTPLGGIGVALFLICSGFGLAESWNKHGMNLYWRKKLLRVFLPYVLVFVCLSFYKRNEYQSPILAIITGVGGYWYIIYLAKWYFVFWITMLIAPRYHLTIMSLVAVVFFFTLSSIKAEQSLSFVAGVFLSEYKDKIKLIKPRILTIFSIVAIMLGTICLLIKQIPSIRGHQECVLNLIQLTIKFDIAIGVLFITRCSQKALSSKFLYFIGIISYELYLLQMPFYNHFGGSFGLASLFILFLMLTSYLFYRLNSWLTNLAMRCLG